MRRIPYLFFLPLVALLGVRCSSSIKIDDAMAAEIAGDRTLIIRPGGEGCNTSPEVGYAYCRKAEGRITDIDRLYFYAPKTNCDREYCGLVEVYSQEGTLVYSDRFPKEGGVVSVAWSDLLPTPYFRRADNSIWPILMRLYWKDNDGDERVTGMRGEARLLVYTPRERRGGPAGPRSYTPLHNSRENPAFAFSSSHGGYLMKWTTSGRAYVGSDR